VPRSSPENPLQHVPVLDDPSISIGPFVLVQQVVHDGGRLFFESRLDLVETIFEVASNEAGVDGEQRRQGGNKDDDKKQDEPGHLSVFLPAGSPPAGGARPRT
jgi:hypothetical protein